MKKVLILGAGLVAGPAVRYLLEKTQQEVWVADQDVGKAKALVAGHPRGQSLELDAGDTERLSQSVAKAHIVVSLLPWSLHARIAALCLEHKKHLVTASYVKDEMRALDKEARDKGLLFLNETGVDPGLDHMSAMRVIDGVKREGGRIISFYSYCGGLPALEANNNPLGYKFSWKGPCWRPPTTAATWMRDTSWRCRAAIFSTTTGSKAYRVQVSLRLT